MANTQVNITANGTTTLATAGKYCDRNVDVNVDVPGKPTQFTNLYDPANVTLKQNISGSSSDGIVITSDSYSNWIKVPFHHVKGESVVLRMRGIGTVRDRMGCLILNADGERVNHYQIPNTTFFEQSYDEYGDVMITFKGNIVTTYEWYYFAFNFQYIGINSGVTEAKTGPIITINEPIGNGGYVE